MWTVLCFKACGHTDKALLHDIIPHDEVDFIFGENDYPYDVFDTLKTVKMGL